MTGVIRQQGTEACCAHTIYRLAYDHMVHDFEMYFRLQGNMLQSLAQ